MSLTVFLSIDGETMRLKLSGRIDTMTAQNLYRGIRTSLDGITNITMDFSNVEYLSSAGLRAILQAKKALPEGGTITVIHANKTVRNIFTLSAFETFINIEE